MTKIIKKNLAGILQFRNFAPSNQKKRYLKFLLQIYQNTKVNVQPIYYNKQNEIKFQPKQK